MEAHDTASVGEAGAPRYRRVLIKLSGESVMGPEGYGIAPEPLAAVASEIAGVRALGVDVGLVIGAGNIFRGLQASARGMDRAVADYMGMLATVLNGLALQEALEKAGVETRVQSALEMRALCEPYIRRRAVRHLEKGRVVIFAGGTGNPYFTTDTAAALRAMEIRAQVVIKATKVDGIYDRDPVAHPDAVFFPRLTYTDALLRDLRVMDATAISLCRENRLPILVVNLFRPGNVRRAVLGERIGTRVSADATEE